MSSPRVRKIFFFQRAIRRSESSKLAICRCGAYRARLGKLKGDSVHLRFIGAQIYAAPFLPYARKRMLTPVLSSQREPLNFVPPIFQHRDFIGHQ